MQMKQTKYFILKRNNPELLKDCQRRLDTKDLNKIIKRCDVNSEFILIEKTCKNDTEVFSNLWTLSDGNVFWLKYTKGQKMYDYTGVVSPLVHIGEEIYTMDNYYKLNQN